MIAIPAVDLREGRCVQLVGGRPEDERVSLPDPPGVAARWAELGFASLHVVDLDAALGRGSNADVVARILESTELDVQVGGGIRDDETAAEFLNRGAARVVVGTRAVTEPAWLERLANRWPNRVVVAVDAREGTIVRKGWVEDTGLAVDAWLPGLAALPLAGVLCTDVGREGRLEGIDRASCLRVLEASPHPVCISGGITGPDELEFLDEAGAASVVLGMALYTDTLDAREVARRWGGRTSQENER